MLAHHLDDWAEQHDGIDEDSAFASGLAEKYHAFNSRGPDADALATLEDGRYIVDRLDGGFQVFEIRTCFDTDHLIFCPNPVCREVLPVQLEPICMACDADMVAVAEYPWLAV